MLRYTFTFLFILSLSALFAQTLTVSGQIRNLSSNSIGGVTIELLDAAANELIESQTVVCNGSYSFSGLVEGQAYNLRLTKEGSSNNGVSTFDLVVISKHMLGIDALNSPLKIRAADIDDSGSVSVMDILLLRAWILGVAIDAPENAWLFFQEDAGTEGPVFPLVLMADQTNYNFTGIKRGDVNDSALPCE